MTITLTSASWARKHIPADGLALELPETTTALQAALKSGIPEDDIGMITRSDIKLEWDAPLIDGDVLYIIPSIIGG